MYSFFFFFLHPSAFQVLDKPWSQVSSLFPPRFLPSICIAHRVQQSHCSSIFHRVLLTHAPALSASQFVHKKKSSRIYTSIRMHSGGLELAKQTYTRLEDNLMRHRGDRCIYVRVQQQCLVGDSTYIDTMVSYRLSKGQRARSCRELHTAGSNVLCSSVGVPDGV